MITHLDELIERCQAYANQMCNTQTSLTHRARLARIIAATSPQTADVVEQMLQAKLNLDYVRSQGWKHHQTRTTNMFQL